VTGNVDVETHGKHQKQRGQREVINAKDQYENKLYEDWS